MDQRARWIAAAFAAVLALATRAAATERPNVVMISIDTLRADHLSCYGYGWATSPVIDGLAREGTLFTNAQSASSWTTPSHMTMMTGLRPSVHGVDRPGRRLGAEHETLAEAFRAAGYDTAAFVGGPTLSSAFGFDRGFGRYDNLMGLPDYAKRNIGGPLLPIDVLERSHAAKPGIAVTNSARNWIAEDARSPFFVFVHLWDPHYDYCPRPPFDRLFDADYAGTFDFSNVEQNPAVDTSMSAADRERLVALYDGEIAATDALVGDLLNTLAALHLDENTIVVLTSDHGEEFFEHRGKGHLQTLYQEIVHVPLVFRYPGHVPAGRRQDALFAPVHLMPTILGLAGITPPPGLQGRDMSAVVEGAAPPDDLWAFSEVSHAHADPIELVRIGHIAMMSDRDSILPPLVFNLVSDPAEQRAHEGSVAKTRIFRRYVEHAIGPTAEEPGTGELDPGTVAQLKALGYLR